MTFAHFYPRPPRGGRHRKVYAVLYRLNISIHALREEGDPLSGNAAVNIFTFLSTPSARRATNELPKLSSSWIISIHALREEGDFERDARTGTRYISIHALREEGDVLPDETPCHCWIFLSTPSARRATLLSSRTL